MLHKLLVICLFTIPCSLISMEATSYLGEETQNRLRIPSGRSVECERAITEARKRYVIDANPPIDSNSSEKQSSSKKQKEGSSLTYTPYPELAAGFTPTYRYNQSKAGISRSQK